MTSLGERIGHRHALVGAALAVLTAEHNLSDDETSTQQLLDAEEALEPWNSDDLSAALGVTVSDEDRHTALGDAKWAMRIYNAVMENVS
jgi:hypothetical protein